MNSSLQLTNKQISKLERIKSASKKLAKYRKYYSKDSLKEVKKYEKQLKEKWKHGFDDVQTKSTKRLKRIKQRADEKLAKLRQPEVLPANTLKESVDKFNPNFELPKIDNSINLDHGLGKSLPISGTELQGLKSIKAPSFNPNLKSTPSLPKMPDLKEIDKVKGELGQYSSKVGEYKNQIGQYKSYLSDDSVRKTELKKEIDAHRKDAEKMATQNVYSGELLKHQKQMEAFKSDQLKYKKEFDQWRDSAYVKKQAREKAEQVAMDYLEKNKELLKGAQSKMDMLMKKYSVVPNSNDLSSAIKRTSLKGRTFKERLVLATNFQILSIDPVISIDFSPMVGYRFNTRFTVGVGGTYRQTFSNSAAPKFAPQVVGYKVFTSYDVIKSFFAYGEFDRNAASVTNPDKSTTVTWKNAAILGVGRKISIARKIDMTVIAGYNFAHQNNDPVYPQPWIFRIGFQTSKLAMFKKKPQIQNLF